MSTTGDVPRRPAGDTPSRHEGGQHGYNNTMTQHATSITEYARMTRRNAEAILTAYVRPQLPGWETDTIREVLNLAAHQHDALAIHVLHLLQHHAPGTPAYAVLADLVHLMHTKAADIRSAASTVSHVCPVTTIQPKDEFL